MQGILVADMMLGDFAAMKRHIADAEKIDAAAARSMRTTYMVLMPSD